MARSEQVQEVADLTNVIIGEHVDTLRKRSHLTLKQLGAVIGIGESAASYKIKGTNPWQAHEVRLLADRFNVSVGMIYGDEPLPLPTVPARVTPLDPTRNAGKLRSDNLQRPVVSLANWKRSA